MFWLVHSLPVVSITTVIRVALMYWCVEITFSCPFCTLYGEGTERKGVTGGSGGVIVWGSTQRGYIPLAFSSNQEVINPVLAGEMLHLHLGRHGNRNKRIPCGR